MKTQGPIRALARAKALTMSRAQTCRVLLVLNAGQSPSSQLAHDVERSAVLGRLGGRWMFMQSWQPQQQLTTRYGPLYGLEDTTDSRALLEVLGSTYHGWVRSGK